jgi:hypothetical protein
MRARQASTTLFLCAQNWKCPYDKATITKNPYETTTKPFKSRLKNLNGKGNGVIQLLIKLYIKMPLRLNSNNKKIKITIKLLKLKLTNLHSKNTCVILFVMVKLKLSNDS